MSKILLSINPEHIARILDGSKEYEFRKVKCKEDIDGIIIYATAPVKQVIAEADIDTILEDTPDEVWKKTKKKSGITADFFFQYYEGKAKAIAYKLTNLNIFDKPKTLADYGIAVAPQAFVYIHE